MKLEVKEHSYMEICNFLFHESELLDSGAFKEWLTLMTEDLVYRVPMRVTKEAGQGTGFLDSMSHIDDTKYTLERRIRRLESEYAWAEIPPSRTRHFISNIRVQPEEKDHEVQVHSNLLIYRSRGDSPAFDLLSGKRQDVLRFTDGQWKLAKRIVLLDQTTLATHNLSFFF